MNFEWCAVARIHMEKILSVTLLSQALPLTDKFASDCCVC